MNEALGSGDEALTPLLAGFAASADGGASARGGAGFGFVGAVEQRSSASSAGASSAGASSAGARILRYILDRSDHFFTRLD